MTSTFFGIHIAKSGLLSSQKGLDVTGHNIANANTPGYSRQNAILQTGIPYTKPTIYSGLAAGQLGTGVEVAELTRSRDAFLDQQINRETANLGFFTGQKNILQGIETVLLEPSDHGISTLLDEFWNGWQDFSKNPENQALKANLVEKANTLTLGINQTYNHLENIRQDISTSALDIEQRSQLLVQEITDLQNQIYRAKVTGQQPNDLYDRKDLLVEELSKLRDFTIDNSPTGGIQINFNDNITVDPVTSEVTINSPSKKGELGGLLEVNNYLDGVLGKVNQLAQELADNVNNVSDSGGNRFLADSDGPFDFFQFDPTSSAKTLSVNPSLVENPGLLATGSVARDGEYAMATINLRHQTMTGEKTTVDQFWQTLVVGVGSKTKEVMRLEENQNVLLTHMDNRRQEISGVSIDEELVNMTKFQYAFQASSRLMTVMDDMLDTLINRMGR